MTKKYNKFNKITFSLFLALFLIWIFQITKTSEQSQNFQKEQFQKEISGKITVIDGDTVKFGYNKRIRLLYIDSPETKQHCFNKNGTRYLCGIMARNFLIRLTKDQEVICRYNKKDIYRRYLAECFIGQKSINEEMIRSGMAIVFGYDDFDPRLKKLQQEAKEKKLGIWQGKFELPKNYRKRVR